MIVLSIKRPCRCIWSWCLLVSALLAAFPAESAGQTGIPSIWYGTALSGEVRACGCMADHLGGLAKRGTVVKKDRNPGDLLLETGSTLVKTPFLSRDELRLARKKVQSLLKIFSSLSLDAWTPDAADLLLFRREIAASGLPVVCANVFSGGTRPFPALREFKANSFRIAVTGLIDPGAKLEHAGLVASDANASLAEIPGDKYDVVIILTSFDALPMLPTLSLPKAKVVYLINGGGNRKLEVPEQHNGVLVFEASDRGRYLGRISLNAKNSADLMRDLSAKLALQSDLAFLRGELANFEKRANIVYQPGGEDALLKAFSAPADVSLLKSLLADLQKKITLLQSQPAEETGISHQLIPLVTSLPDDPAIKKALRGIK